MTARICRVSLAGKRADGEVCVLVCLGKSEERERGLREEPFLSSEGRTQNSEGCLGRHPSPKRASILLLLPLFFKGLLCHGVKTLDKLIPGGKTPVAGHCRVERFWGGPGGRE